MHYIHNLKKYKKVRKMLRRNMTDTERILWSYLKGKQLHNYKFRRQHGIGNYIVDFYCPELKLVIKLDGGQHADEHNIKYDKGRTDYLNSLEIKVLRYWNNDIYEHIDGVIEDIVGHINNKNHPLTPS